MLAHVEILRPRMAEVSGGATAVLAAGRVDVFVVNTVNRLDPAVLASKEVSTSSISPGVSDTTPSSPAARQRSQQSTPGVGPQSHSTAPVLSGGFTGNATVPCSSRSPAEQNASPYSMQRPPLMPAYSNTQPSTLSPQSPTPGYRPMTGPNGSRPKDNLCRPIYMRIGKRQEKTSRDRRPWKEYPVDDKDNAKPSNETHSPGCIRSNVANTVPTSSSRDATPSINSSLAVYTMIALEYERKAFYVARMTDRPHARTSTPYNPVVEACHVSEALDHGEGIARFECQTVGATEKQA
ncbi:hypothetical protein M409DRAFT_53293 [Zasmidium cellare ATCC 36951]|uniref:Uncharacterized protein n=1 Tax=Zasmidium cellare ATCC 36951 TaxID=1080233 RepID=A0A6A6CT53_ZASCE|nr:uncharacterized protein M409DRAFT_53293 [Zasmidium cellare ATCC 36951]KAF2168656.1 hypothetical protein M409DRAFT_53293 [Zasmidium cellare ATCC 36951]